MSMFLCYIELIMIQYEIIFGASPNFGIKFCVVYAVFCFDFSASITETFLKPGGTADMLAPIWNFDQKFLVSFVLFPVVFTYVCATKKALEGIENPPF